MKRFMLGAIGFVALVGTTAQAHVALVFPVARPGNPGSAYGEPCGFDTDPGRTTSTPLLPGSTVEVRWAETINHPGHFRISFDDNGQDNFVDPDSYTDFYTDPSVLLDNIPDVAGVTQHSATIVLPMIECDNCTLQLMQVRTDDPPFINLPGSIDMHRLCADLTLTLDAEFVFDDGFED